MAIDFRSDVLAPPCASAIAAMQAVASGPMSFSRREDALQRALEQEVSEAFGFEDGLFLPTATLANQIAIRLWCGPGEIMLADHESHVAVNEAASVAGMNGVAIRKLRGDKGHLCPDAIGAALVPQPESAPGRKLRLVWLENTHNGAGGTIMPRNWLGDIVKVCAGNSIPVHVDGARIFHAVQGSRVPVEEIAKDASSLTICLKKGPGAPMGAILLGDAEFIDEASQVQRMFGALWRPVTLLAAAARAAFAAWPARVAFAHDRAHEFAELLQTRLAGRAMIPTPQTNIVMLELGSEGEVVAALAALREGGVLASNYRHARIRFVAHAGITSADVVQAAGTVAAALDKFAR